MRGRDLREYIQAIVQLKGVVGPDVNRQFNDLIKLGTLPAILKAFFDLYMEGLKIQTLYIFKELLEIGRANEKRLGSSAMEWAKSQTQMLIRYHRHNIKIWVQEVCHEHVYDESASVDERIFWNSWQAPSFLVMKPWLYRPYEPDRVWELQDAGTSRKWLEAIADHYVLLLEMALKHAAKDGRQRRVDRPDQLGRESNLPNEKRTEDR
jgi:hypothetical protein